MKKQYSKEEIKAFYGKQRERWMKSKELVNTDECLGILREMAAQGVSNVSPTSIMFVVSQLKELGLPGLPFIDVKTFQGWKEIGYTVIKGQKAIINGVSWKPTERTNKETGETEETGGGRLLAKSYSLFHRSQVQRIEEQKQDHETTYFESRPFEDRQDLELQQENEVREANQD